MGKIEALKISLEKRPSIYSPGERLSGRVLIRLSGESLKADNVHVSLTGDSKVHWIEDDKKDGETKSKSDKKPKHFNSQESYFSIKVLLHQKRSKEDTIVIPIGESSYLFEMQLPTNLPTSFEHAYGRIRYFVCATIEIPWEKNINSVRLFSVVSPLDLNTNYMLKEPYGVSGDKQISCSLCPCKSAPITCQFSINRSGFVPGESIVFDVNIDNKSSSKEVSDLKVSLIQKVIFYAKADTKKSYRCVATTIYPRNIAPKSNEKWSSHLIIPPVSSSTNGKCRIIDVYYVMLCSFETNGLGSKQTTLIIPITIGTKPFLDPTKANVAMRYELCHFDPIKFVEDIKGGLIESDINTFRPYYPYRLDEPLKI